jgi:alkanesulfonate monooxygenase SsuD/methylene tetrahydromethanopterin reductase-like flavin-dependent oxidoreductase (luciferase family)
LGAGWHEWEAKAYGYDFPPVGARLDMLEEAVPLVRALLDADAGRVTHEGEWFRLDNASCEQSPVQSRLPLWLGGIGEKRTLRTAARHADGWNAAYVPPDEFRRLNGVLDAWCAREGRDPSSIRRAINLQFMLAPAAPTAASIGASVEARWGELAPRVMAGGLTGVPDDAVARIAEYVDAGADAVNIALRAPWPPESLDAWIDDVVPRVRRSYS